MSFEWRVQVHIHVISEDVCNKCYKCLLVAETSLECCVNAAVVVTASGWFNLFLGLTNEKDNLTQALTIVKDFVEDISGDKLQELLQMPPYVHIMQLFDHTWTCSEMTMAICRHLDFICGHG